MEKNEKSIITYLLQEFPSRIINQILFLHENFPTPEEGLDRLNETVYSYFKYYQYYDTEIVKLIQECCLIAMIDTTIFIPEFLKFFVQIPLDMEITNFDYPAFLNDSLKDSILTSISYRYSTFYVINLILTDFYYKLVVENGPLNKKDIEYIFKSLVDVLFTPIDHKNALQMNLIFVPKLSIIVYFISISIPDIVFEEAKKHIQKLPTECSFYQFFTLRFFSSFIYPKNILSEHLSSLNSIFIPLINYIISNKTISNLLISGNEFFKNFLGNALKMEQTNESLLLLKEINKMYNKIQSEQLSFNSTLVLYSTLCPQTNSLFQVQRFLTNISKQISTRASDTLKTFTAIIKGSNYCPYEICKITGENFRWRINKSDTNYLTQMIDIVVSNKSLFSVCQTNLANFFTQLSATKFAWFVQHHFNRIIEEDFFDENGEAVIEFSILLLKPKSPFLVYSNVHSNDPIISQFRNQMQRICAQILDTKSYTNANGDSVTYKTNSFTKALNFNSFEYEIEHIVDHTTIVPLNKTEVFPIADVFQDWKDLIQGNNNFSEYISNIEESSLKTFEQQNMVELLNSSAHNMIIKALNLYFITEQIDGDNSNNSILNKIPMFLLSKSPLLSAFTIRLLQAYVHVTKNTSALETLLTIQVQQHEEIYIFGLALLHIIESLVYCEIQLSPILYESIFAWQCALIAAPYIQTREIGFMIADAVVPISPKNSPNIALFIKENEDKISHKAIKKFISYFSIEKIKGYKIVKFRDVSRTSSYLLFHTFLSTTFLMFNSTIQSSQPSYHKIFQAQILTLINARPVNNTLLDNISDCFFCLNLMTIRLATTSSFDQNTNISNLKGMIKQAKKILSVFKQKTTITLSFYSSVNPLLEFPLKRPTNGFNLLILCYTILFYRKRYDLKLIEKYFREILEYLNSHDYIRTEIYQINPIMLNDIEKGMVPMSLCYMMVTLNKIFKNLMKQLVFNDNSSFLRTDVYKLDNSHPFDPNYWFPFLFNIVAMPPLQFPFLFAIVYNVITLYCSFTPIPMKFVNDFIGKCSTVNTLDLYTSIIQTSSELTLDFFASKSAENIVFFRSICNCFRKPNNVKKDLESLIENINNRIINDEIRGRNFDNAIYEHIGSLLANSSFYLCYNNGSEREISFKLIYHISLFAIVQGWPASNKLIPILDDFNQHYLNAAFPIPISQLHHLQKHLSIVFHSFSEQFLFKTLHIISSRLSVRSFIESIVPWFENVIITGKYGIVPNSIKTYFTSYFFVNSILNISFRKTLILDEHFTQTPMPINSMFIIEQITKTNPLYFIDFILYERLSTKSLILYLALRYQDIVLPYLIDFLSFNYTFHCKIKSKNEERYEFVIKTILSTIISLLKENSQVIESKLHIVFLFCYINFDFDKFRVNDLMEKIYNFYSVDNEEDCIKKFNEIQINDIFNESFKWMISYGKIERSIRAIKIFSHISKIDENKKEDIIKAIKIICALLNQSNEIKDISIYCNFISKLMLMLDNIGSPLVDFSVDFLICNSSSFTPLFESSLSIVSKNIDGLEKNFDAIFYRLISADLTPKLIDLIFGLIVKMVLADFNCDKDIVFFALLPFIYQNGHHSMPISSNTTNKKIEHTSVKSAARQYSVPNLKSSSPSVKFRDLNQTTNLQISNKKANLTSVSTSNFQNISSVPIKEIDYSQNINNIVVDENKTNNVKNNEIILKLIQIFGDRVDLVANLPFQNFISNGRFNNILSNLISTIPGEIQFRIVSFFMEILRASNNKYFSIIYMISFFYLSMNANELPVSPSIFTPIAQRVLMLNYANNSLLKNFIKVFENFKTPILPPKINGSKNFPLLPLTKNLELSFKESLPFLIQDDCFSDCSITHDLCKAVNEMSITRFESRDKEFEEGKNLKVSDNQYFPQLEKNSNVIIERIKSVIKKTEKKEINLNMKEALIIQKVNIDVFKVSIDEVNSLLDY